jgi:hypothetical protein
MPDYRQDCVRPETERETERANYRFARFKKQRISFSDPQGNSGRAPEKPAQFEPSTDGDHGGTPGERYEKVRNPDKKIELNPGARRQQVICSKHICGKQAKERNAEVKTNADPSAREVFSPGPYPCHPVNANGEREG